MKETKVVPAFFLSLIASNLIILNGLWIAVEGSPIELSFYHDSESWSQISLGIRGLVEGVGALFWLIFSVAMLASAIKIYVKPRTQKTLGLPIMLFSILSIPIGGGFVLGLILGLIGGACGIEWPKPLGATFLGKMIRAVRFDSKLYRSITDDPTNMKTAAIIIVFVNLLSGLGNSLYINYLNNKSPDVLVIFSGISYIGIAFVKWLILTLAIYIVGVKLMACSSEFDKIARAIAFAYVPICFQAFLPLVVSNEPSIKYYNWPMSIFFLTNFWMIFALVVAAREALDISTSKAMGVIALGGTIYWLINNFFIAPALGLPGIRFQLAVPESLPALMVLITFASILATLLGVFTRK